MNVSFYSQTYNIQHLRRYLTNNKFVFFFFFLYIKILIYNITHETKKSKSPGTENLRCLGIQKKERKRKKKKKS